MNEARGRVVAVVNDLPALPSVLHEVLLAIDLPDTTVEEVAELIERDAALSAKILRIANSAFFGYEREVASVLSAVILVGLRQVGYVALSLTVNAELARFGKHLDFVRFSKHAAACGLISRAIGAQMGLRDLDKCFVIGMLHDIGQVVLGVANPEAWRTIEQSDYGEEPRFDAERRLFGFDHGEAGALLAEKWGLPPDVCDDIRCHHEPIRDGQPLGRRQVVTMADILCHRIGMPSLAPVPQSGDLDPVAARVLEGLDSEAITSSVTAALEIPDGGTE